MTCQFLFRQRFRNPSGSFRNPHKKMTPCNLPATLPESFRKLPELQRNSKTVCNTSGNASGILPEASGTRVIRKLTKMNHFRQSPLFQVTEVIKVTQLKKLSKGFYDGHHIYIYIYILDRIARQRRASGPTLGPRGLRGTPPWAQGPLQSPRFWDGGAPWAPCALGSPTTTP